MRGEGIVPVMEVGNNNGNSGFGGFGNDWAWVIILFLIFGWGGNGFGRGFGGNGGGVVDGYALQTDFATLERKLDSISSGICDATFALNNNLNSGFFGVQNSLTQGFAGINTALLQGNYNLSAQLADCCCGLKSQLADCCCTTQRAIDGINYNLATNTCAITNAINTGVRDIVDNQNANYRALHDEIVANRIEDKNAQIQAQQNEINALRLKASQEAQNAYLISQLGPKCPEPAYVVNGPTPVNFPTNCCNTFSGFNSCGNY